MVQGPKIFQLDVNYRWSTIVLDERFEDKPIEKIAYGVAGHDVRAGDRAPDAPELISLTPKGKGETTRLFDVFKPDVHTVLLFGSGDLKELDAALDILRIHPRELFKLVLIVAPGAVIQGNVEDLDIILEDTKGNAKEGYGLQDSTAPVMILVRPDGMIGAFAISERGVQSYLSVVFFHA